MPKISYCGLYVSVVTQIYGTFYLFFQFSVSVCGLQHHATWFIPTNDTIFHAVVWMIEEWWHANKETVLRAKCTLIWYLIISFVIYSVFSSLCDFSVDFSFLFLSYDFVNKNPRSSNPKYIWNLDDPLGS